uniref:non-specific serine/threonine protein kinase n=1 Tax=Oryza brachyantha TaxID=4533 RepID=J3MIL3_ORYBR
MSVSGGRTRVGRYELGRTLGEGTFAKVKFARNVETGENVAIKILDKEKVLKHRMIAQIKREISTMKLIRHPNVIRMYEVMASKTKIYIVMELVTGGELFDKIASRGRLKEDDARKYFQQLINAVDYCHSRGVYHRDLKPENLLLDASGTLKVSDFGLSALSQQVREDGLLHTTCGTPNYVAPEVINNKGYDGAKADLWSCGVILFVLMAGYLPFEDSNLMSLYKKIFKADFSCPSWFSTSAKKLIKKILDPNPSTRITIADLINNEWFKKGYQPPRFETADVNLDDVNSIFNESGDQAQLVVERREERPSVMNAFELISTSQGLNLGTLFEKQSGSVKRETRFASRLPANEILSKIEAAAGPMGFNVQKRNYKLKLQGENPGRKGQLAIATEVFEVTPSLYMVELRKSNGDTLEFHKFYHSISNGLKDVMWKPESSIIEGDEIQHRSSAGASSPPPQTNAASIDWLGGEQISKVGSSSHIAPRAPQPSLSTNAAGAALDFSQPSCRPWERGDLLRRLATFKSSTWASKPKAAGSLACARRGWVNIEMDKIECESCGAHLIFTALTSWSPAEVANAGEAFAEQLDASHQSDCPWRGNSCADSLVQFHLTPSALVGGFKDRCDGLLQFRSLPVIAESAIQSMKLTRSPQIDCILSQSITILSGELDYKTDSTTGIDINHQDESCSYSQAQKIISLCGWEPRWLPNVQDWEENSTRSAKHTASADPDQLRPCLPEHKQNSYSASVKKDKGKGKIRVKDSGCSMRSPLLDCSLCAATVRIWDFRSVPRPSHLSINNSDAPDTRKGLLTRGISATSGINGWVAEGTEKDNVEGRDEAGTDEGKSLSNAPVDLNLTMAGGLPSTHSAMPSMPDHFNDGGMGRDLMIGQPTGSEIGGLAASFESRGPSSRKRNLEEGGSTADKPLNRLHPADSIEGTVIDRDGDEVDDGAQDSDIRSNKRPRGFNLFDVNRPSSSGAGPSRNLSFDLDIDINRFDAYKAEGPSALHNPSARDSFRASSVIAMNTVQNVEENSTESVEYHPCDVDDVHKPSSALRSGGMSEPLDLNYSNQAQQSSFVQPAAESNAREIGGSSMNGGEEVLNAEATTAFARDQLSLGVSGGSVGMGASHEAEIHGIDVSEHKTDSVVGDVEPAPELTENMGNTGESAPGPGMMDEFVPEDVGREEPQGDSQDVASRLVGRADSGSKTCGSTKADSVESGEKISHAVGHESNLQHSLSRNARVYSGIDLSKDEVTQTAKDLANDDYDPGDDLAAANGGNDYEAGLPEFDPIRHHNNYCPWVNGHVAAVCCINTGSSTSTGLSGWQLTVDALETIQSLGQAQNQIMPSDSAASLYKDDHVARPSRKLLKRASHSKC